MRLIGGAVMAGCMVLCGLSALAAEGGGERGSVTNLPIPRYVSLKTGEGNVRRGPSLTHRIDWVFKARGMPLEITGGEFGHWRRVRDRDGVGGWMHYSLLSGARTVIIETDLTALFQRADPSTRVNAYLEAGVIARVDECADDWCLLRADGHKGWASKSAIWGGCATTRSSSRWN